MIEIEPNTIIKFLSDEKYYQAVELFKKFAKADCECKKGKIKWEELFKVVDKIEKNGYTVTVSAGDCHVRTYDGNIRTFSVTGNKQHSTFIACYTFVKQRYPEYLEQPLTLNDDLQ